MSDVSPACANDFQESVNIRSIELELGGQLSEEKNLNGSSGSIPRCKER